MVPSVGLVEYLLPGHPKNLKAAVSPTPVQMPLSANPEYRKMAMENAELHQQLADWRGADVDARRYVIVPTHIQDIQGI